MTRAALAAGAVLLAALGAPLAAADTVVDAKAAAQRGDDGTLTASIEVINTGPDAVTLRPVVVPAVAGCLPTADPASVAAGSSTTVTVTLPQACFADGSTPVAVDLDGVGPRQRLPATVVTPPTDDSTSWASLWWGLFVGLLMAVAVGLRGYTEHEETQAQIVGSRGGRAKRRKAYLAVQEIVKDRMADLTSARLNWKKLKAPVYGLTSPIGNLEAGWSFKDSWVANLTVASTALIALLTSADALTSVLGEKPASALGVMTVAGLVSAAIIGVANTVVKLVGPKVSVVTVAGLIASTALVVLAAGFQVVTVALCVAGATGSWPLRVGAVLLAVVVGGVLEVYAFRSLGQTIRTGFADSLPAVPADAVTAWAASDPWEKSVVEAQIRATYGEWLQKDRSRPARNSIPGMADWTPVQPAAAPDTRRRSLL
jgi:hypothetical protein